MAQLSPEVQRVMQQHNVPPQCIGCLVMQSRANVWLAMHLMDQAGVPNDPLTATVKPTAEEHMREYPIGCPGTNDGQCHSPMFTPGKP